MWSVLTRFSQSKYYVGRKECSQLALATIIIIIICLSAFVSGCVTTKINKSTKYTSTPSIRSGRSTSQKTVRTRESEGRVTEQRGRRQEKRNRRQRILKKYIRLSIEFTIHHVMFRLGKSGHSSAGSGAEKLPPYCSVLCQVPDV